MESVVHVGRVRCQYCMLLLAKTAPKLCSALGPSGNSCEELWWRTLTVTPQEKKLPQLVAEN